MAMKLRSSSKFEEAKPLLIGLAVVAAVAGFVGVMYALNQSTDIRSKAASNLACEQVCANVGTGLQEAGTQNTAKKQCINKCKTAQEAAAKKAAKEAAAKAAEEKRLRNLQKQQQERTPRLRQGR